VQALGLLVTRVQLAVPVRVAAHVGSVALQVDAAGPEQGVQQLEQRSIAHRAQVIGVQAARLAARGMRQHHRREQEMGVAPQVLNQPTQNRAHEPAGRFSPSGTLNKQVAALLQVRIDARTDAALDMRRSVECTADARTRLFVNRAVEDADEVFDGG